MKATTPKLIRQHFVERQMNGKAISRISVEKRSILRFIDRRQLRTSFAEIEIHILLNSYSSVCLALSPSPLHPLFFLYALGFIWINKVQKSFVFIIFEAYSKFALSKPVRISIEKKNICCNPRSIFLLSQMLFIFIVTSLDRMFCMNSRQNSVERVFRIRTVCETYGKLDHAAN